VLAGRLAQPKEHDRRLLLRLEADQEHLARLLQVAVGRAQRGAGDPGSEELHLLRGVLAGAEVDVVGV
jgi:hypothetical protein